MDWFQDKKILITGGSSGIGKAAASWLAEWGADICIAARNEHRLQQACSAIRKNTVGKEQRILYHVLDVCDRRKVFDRAGKIIESLGGLDILINSAGTAWPGYIQTLPDSVWDETMNTNFMGTVNCTRAFLPHFMNQKSGSIANVASLLGFMGLFGYSAYSASKFAVAGFSESLRQDLLPYNIKISLFYPPDTDTPLWHAENRIKPPETKALAGTLKVMSPEKAAYILLKGIARGRFTIIPGVRSKCIYRVQRWFPSLFRWLLERKLKKVLRGSYV
jgi:3-dehydrosphinganine reductase